MCVLIARGVVWDFNVLQILKSATVSHKIEVLANRIITVILKFLLTF